MILDCITYLADDILVKVDRASMSTSLETRAPFLDRNLLNMFGKYLILNQKWSINYLKEILKQYVPKHLTEKPKTGFAVPIDIWLRGPLKDWAKFIKEKKLREENYFNQKLISNKNLEHLSGKELAV